MLFIGIDPGLDGALAFIDDGVDDGELVLEKKVSLFDMPVFKVGKRRDYSIKHFIGFFEYVNRKLKKCIVGMEALHAMPANMRGGVANFSMGRASGLIEGVLSTLAIPYEKIPPQRWKKVLLDGMPQGKGASILVANRLFPDVELPRKKDHNRADALLIAEYLRRTYRPNWEGEAK